MRRYLVVANQTLGGAALAEEVHQRARAGPCAFHIVVPATRPSDHLVWTEGEAHAIARQRLEQALRWFDSQGLDATGAVGDAKPMLAIEDALIAQVFDGIILSTLPAGVSRWLRQDLPARVSRHFGLPMRHVISQPAVEHKPA